MQNPSAPTIFLASSSPYRRGLLDRFLDQYEAVSPDVDETNVDNLPPDELATQLARKKAEYVSSNAPRALVIGADQLAVLGDRVLPAAVMIRMRSVTDAVSKLAGRRVARSSASR